MEFNLKRQVISEDLVQIVSRLYKTKDLDPYKMTKKNFEELEKVLEEIEQRTLPRYLVQKKLNGKLGYGIFLHPEAEPILKGQVIAPYAGEVSIVPQFQQDEANYAFDPVNDLRLTKEEQSRFDPKNRYHPRRLYALKLDAAKKGNFTRFINHSHQPNVVAYLVSSKKHPYEIIYFAKKTIQPGEQLLVSYEDGEESYWGVLGITPFRMTPRTFQLNDSLQIVTQSRLGRQLAVSRSKRSNK